MNRRELTAYTTSAWRINGGYWEAPAVLMRETVACGSHGCLFWPADVLRAMAAAWHDIPVSLDHPKVDGVPCSINHSPAIFARHALGFVVAPHYDATHKALKATIRVPQGHPRMIQIQQLREVSIGVFSNEVAVSGEYQGQAYEGRVLSGTPDHLAILPEGITGACSWAEQGCGVRINQESLQILQAAALTALNHVTKGEYSMNTEHGTLLPPGVVEEAEINVNAILKDWEGFEGLMPAEIVALTSGHRPKATSHDECGATLLPRGVV